MTTKMGGPPAGEPMVQGNTRTHGCRDITPTRTLPQVRIVVIDGIKYLNFSEYDRADEARRCFCAEQITRGLGGEWYGSCGWLVCPVCKCDKPTLAIGADKEGQLLLACNGGCSYGELIHTLRDRHLFSFRSRIFCMPDGGEAALREQVMAAQAIAAGLTPGGDNGE